MGIHFYVIRTIMMDAMPGKRDIDGFIEHGRLFASLVSRLREDPAAAKKLLDATGNDLLWRKHMLETIKKAFVREDPAAAKKLSDATGDASPWRKHMLEKMQKVHSTN